MVELYCKLIINKRKSFDQVPENLMEQVETRLYKLGYDTDGNPLPEEE